MTPSYGRRRFGEPPLAEPYRGWGLHGSNNVHYLPTQREIFRKCALIRELLTAQERQCRRFPGKVPS